jgi:hypothetical protein
MTPAILGTCADKFSGRQSHRALLRIDPGERCDPQAFRDLREILRDILRS